MVGRTPEYLGKKIRRARDQARRALHPDHAGAGAASAPASRWRCPAGRAADAQHRAARPLRGALRLHLGRQQQRLGVRRALASTPTSTTPRSAWRCCSAGSCRSCSCSALAGSLAGSSPVPATAGHAADAPAAVRRACSSAWSSIVVGLTFFPALALGPLAEGLVMTTDHARPPRDDQRAARRRRRALLDPQHAADVAAGRAAQARPARAGAQPGHVRRRDRRGARPPCWRSPTRRCSPG